VTLLYKNIPALLKGHPNWVVWGIRGAPPKAPYNPAEVLSGQPTPARADARDTWGSYSDAAECVARGMARGIGYEFDGSGIHGVDLDRVVSGSSGKIDPQVQGIVDKLDSYTEFSPSATGLHIIVLAPGADITRHRKKDHFIEIYGKGRYFTFTGITYGGAKPIEARTEELQAVHDEYLLPEAALKSPFSSLPMRISATKQAWFLRAGLERDKTFAALWGGERHHGNESADDIALMNKLAYWQNADPGAMIRAFATSPYFAQKDEAHRKKCHRTDYLPNTARKSCATVYSTADAEYERWQRRSKTERNCAR